MSRLITERVQISKERGEWESLLYLVLGRVATPDSVKVLPYYMISSKETIIGSISIFSL